MPIGLAATWDPDLHFRMATAISDEARAKNNEFIRRGKRSIYQGLTFWTPNINLVRDPRWGRGMETYGEDPYLVGRHGGAVHQRAAGQRSEVPESGGDGQAFRGAQRTRNRRATASMPRWMRRDLRDSYLPHFEAAVREGGAYSVMCAYNRVDGEPACASPRLLEQTSCASSGASRATWFPIAARWAISSAATKSRRAWRRPRRRP